MQRKLRKIMVILLSLVFVVSGVSISNAAFDSSVVLSTNQIVENIAVGSPVAQLSVSNPTSGITYTYALVNGIGDKDNDSFEIVNIPYTAIPFLKTKTAIDYETKNKYSIRIRATGNDGSSYVKKFDLTVVNINDAPTAYDKTYTTKTGAAISGTLSANDFDGNTLWFSIGENTRGVSVAATAYGAVSITNVNTGAFTYTPTTTYTGALTDSFKFSVYDGVYLSNATATIKINKEDVSSSDVSLSISPKMINLNSSNGKSPILAVIKLGANYNADNIDLNSLKLMVGDKELTNIKKPARIYKDSKGNIYIKAMFYRSDILKTIDPDNNGKLTFTASLLLKNGTAAGTLLKASEEVKVKLPASFKDHKNDDKKDKHDKKDQNDKKDKYEDDDEDEDDD